MDFGGGWVGGRRLRRRWGAVATCLLLAFASSEQPCFKSARAVTSRLGDQRREAIGRNALSGLPSARDERPQPAGHPEREARMRSSPQGFRARIGYPYVPNCRALSSPPAPPNVSTIGPNSTSARPAPSITVTHPAHGRAPAIQPVHRSMSLSADSGTGLLTQMSAIWARPPGLRTRATSR